MKKININILKKTVRIVCLAVCMSAGNACNSYLDIVPEDGLATLDNAFAMRSEAEKYLWTCYSYMPKDGDVTLDPSILGGDELWSTYNLTYHPFVDISKWERAATACKEAIELCQPEVRLYKYTSAAVLSDTVKQELYLDSLIVEGFGDTNPHDVTLYSIGRNEKLSAPVPVQINPLTPVVQTTQVQISAAFGGVSLAYNNPSKANLAFELMMIDSTGLWTPLQTFYAGATSGRFSCRGLDNKETTFGIYIRDRWFNKSDTLMETLIPFEEIVIPKDKFINAKLPGDTWAPMEGLSAYNIEYAWDDKLSPSGWNNVFGCTGTAILPHHFTIDVGYKVALSRFKLYPRMQYEVYDAYLPRIFELWGSDNPPADESWDNWTRLGRWHMVKPSGYGVGRDVGPITAEYREYLSNGAEFEIEPSDELLDPYIPVTHIRFRTFATFYTYLTAQTTAGVMIAELTFFGQLKDN